MDFTGERFIPDAGLESEIEIEHLQRYQSITRLIANKVVLDAASGAGYGSKIMAEQAAQVYGLEISQEAVAFSTEKYIAPNLCFSQGSIADLPFADHTLDRVVSFETIEHVDEEIQNSFIKEIKRVLKPDGLLIMSSPDKHIYSDLPGFHNEHHVKEFYRDEFLAFLKQSFHHIQLYEQFAELSYLLTSTPASPLHSVGPTPSGQGKYLIAVCSNVPLTAADRIDSLVIDRSQSFQKKIDRIVSLQDEVDEKNRVIDDKNTLAYHAYRRLFDRDEELSRQLLQLQAKEAAISHLELQVANKEAALAACRLESQQRQETLDHIRATLGFRLLQQGYRLKNKLLFWK